MGSFFGRLRVIRLEGGYGWALQQPLVFDSAIAGRLIIPAGFVTDFASVPRLPLVFLLAGDTAHEAAVVHDYLYRRAPLIGTPPRPITRAEADAVFLEAMQATGIPAWRRRLMYAAVRAGGWRPWGQYRQASPVPP